MSRPLIDVVENINEIDKFYVKGEDDYYYCWLNKKSENLERNKLIYGYEILGSQHTENALVPPNAVGERVMGDLVLARMPRERYERIQKMKSKKAQEQLTAANEAWMDAAERSGLTTENTTKITKKEFTVQ